MISSTDQRPPSLDSLNSSQGEEDDYGVAAKNKWISPQEEAHKSVSSQVRKIAIQVTLIAATIMAIGVLLYFAAPVAIPVALAAFLLVQTGALAWAIKSLSTLRSEARLQDLQAQLLDESLS